MLSPMGVIDLMVFLPFYVSVFFPVDLRILRAIRIVRIFMILKIGNYATSMNRVIHVVRNKKEELIVTASLGIILLLLSGSAIYYLENEAQPHVFSSIPASLWWSVVTLSTVGYGDIYPITTGGKIFASFIAILGIALFALPAGIIASGFAEEIKAKKQRSCPHCHKELHAN
jgi:voltage-gated potassium channel